MSDLHQPYLELCFRPNVPLVSVTRNFVSEFYNEILADPDATSRIALATHELLENTVKYSADGATRLRIEVVVGQGATGEVMITTSNRVRPENALEIRRLFDAMAAQPDPFVYYQQMMRQSLNRRHGSGLGLARIRAEGEMAMSCELESERVSIVAKTSVTLRMVTA